MSVYNTEHGHIPLADGGLHSETYFGRCKHTQLQVVKGELQETRDELRQKCDELKQSQETVAQLEKIVTSQSAVLAKEVKESREKVQTHEAILNQH